MQCYAFGVDTATYVAADQRAFKSTATGTTDYVYFNGQKIAKVDSKKPMLHLHGYRDASNVACGVEGPTSGLAAGFAGSVVQTGDQFVFDMKQSLPSYGGLIVVFQEGMGADIADTVTGTDLWFNGTTDTTWRHYRGDLSSFAGNHYGQMYASIHNMMPTGTFDMYFANVAILHADGTSTPIYNGQPGVSVANFSGNQCGAQQLTAATELTPDTDPVASTTYYLSDHLGTTQMELSAGGLPLWQGQFTPFGQEIVNGVTNNLIGQQTPDGTAMRYKFTGKERDTESGLDYFGARYMASMMGRFMSPDPSGLSYANPEDPQSLNFYAYVGNHPLTYVDPYGLNWFTTAPCSNAQYAGLSLGGEIKNFVGHLLQTVEEAVVAATI